MNSMDLTLPLTLMVVVAALAWTFVQIRGLNRRLSLLERQHLALVADLEEKLYPSQDR